MTVRDFLFALCALSIIGCGFCIGLGVALNYGG